ncbi:hypothetical protein HDU93_005965, partial [Gonapodya sp. JEL0774]
MSGASAEERAQWRLGSDPSKFAYLAGAKNHRANGIDDAANLRLLRSVMKTLGFNRSVQQAIFQALAGILHLGNIEFKVDTGKAGSDVDAVVKNPDQLDIAAQLLGVKFESLEAALTNQNVLVGDTVCTNFLNVEQAKIARDQLATTVYSLLFSYVVETVNNRLGSNQPANFIGILDMAGFEDSQPSGINGFQQLMTNYTIEKIHQFAIKDLVDNERAIYAREGVPVAGKVEAPEDGSCLTVFEDRSYGLIRHLDEQSNMKGDAGKELEVIDALKQLQVDNSFVAVGRKPLQFVIRHSSGTVTYDATGFVQRSKTYMPQDYFKLFDPASGTDGRARGKASTLLARLFRDQKVDIMHPRSRRSVVM